MDDQVKCQGCKSMIDGAATECPKCGPLVRCSECSARVTAGTKECPGCGATLPDSPARASKGWESWATKMTAILAVLAALSTGQSGSANLASILEQGKVNDEWAYYQATSGKYHLADNLAALCKALAAGRSTAETDAYVKQMEAEAAKELEKKNEVEKAARDNELERNKCVEKSIWCDMAFAALQLGVILSTLSVGAKRKSLLGISALAGLFGVFFIVNGFVGVVPMPALLRGKVIKIAPKVPLKAPPNGDSGGK
jgi:hypothetical protein